MYLFTFTIVIKASVSGTGNVTVVVWTR